MLLRALELIVLAHSFKLHRSREQVLPMQESSRYGNLVRPYYSALQVPFFRKFRTLKLGEEKLQLREDIGTRRGVTIGWQALPSGALEIPSRLLKPGPTVISLLPSRSHCDWNIYMGSLEHDASKSLSSSPKHASSLF